MFAEEEVKDASVEITISTPLEFGNEMKLLKAWMLGKWNSFNFCSDLFAMVLTIDFHLCLNQIDRIFSVE